MPRFWCGGWVGAVPENKQRTGFDKKPKPKQCNHEIWHLLFTKLHDTVQDFVSILLFFSFDFTTTEISTVLLKIGPKTVSPTRREKGEREIKAVTNLAM